MKTLSINDSTFQIENSAHKFISQQITQLETFVEKYHIDQELYQEILERIEEKLQDKREKKTKAEQNKGLTQKDCVTIINEIGSPEEIFEDEITTNNNINNTEKKDTKKNKKHKNINKIFFLNKNYSKKDKGISIGILILWGFFLIYIIPVISFFFLFWKILTIIIIIFLAIRTSNFKGTGENKRKDIKRTSQIKNIFGKLGKSVFGVIKTIFKYFFTAARIIFFIGFGIFLLGLTGGIILVLGAYFSNLSLQNMEVFGSFPSVFPLAGIFGGLSLIIFALLLINYGIRKKGLKNIWIITATISLFSGILFACITGFSLINTYVSPKPQTIKKEAILFSGENFDKNAVYDLSFRRLYYNDSFRLLGLPINHFNLMGATLKVSDNDIFKVVYETEYYGAKNIKKQTLESINTIVLVEDNKDIYFKNGDNRNLDTTKKLPLIITNIKLKEIYIPKNMKFKGYGKSQILLPQKYNTLEPYLNTNYCKDYFYDNDLKRFSCTIDENDKKEVEKMITVRQLYKNLSTLSPIKHKNEYKRDYYLEVCHNHHNDTFNCRSDWMINYESIKIENGIINFSYFDQSLEIEASVKITENDPGKYSFSDFEIKEVEKNHNFNERFYEKESLNSISEEIEDVKEDITAKNKQTAFKDYTSYDAGIFDGNKSLSFDNLKAKNVREITKNNGFLKNWKHPFYYNLANHGKNREGKKIGNFNVIEQTDSNNEIYYIVKKNGKEIYKSDKTNFLTQEPFKNFVVNNDGWWLFYHKNTYNKYNDTYDSKGVLVHNGKALDNQDSFGLNNFSGKTFYFFQTNDGKISFYLDGKNFETNFDEIIHDRCCEPAAYNMKISTDGRVAFWGIIGENFSYNEMKLAGF